MSLAFLKYSLICDYLNVMISDFPSEDRYSNMNMARGLKKFTSYILIIASIVHIVTGNIYVQGRRHHIWSGPVE